MVSNKYKNGLVLILVLLWTGSTIVFSQEYINTRKISFFRGDTAVVAGILADVKIDKVEPHLFYVWYSSSHIYTNQGGYSGNLLHGEYVEYSITGNLILKGYYNRGLKSGRWVHWYQKGSLEEVVEYEEGLREGSSIRYTADGRIIFSATYRNGQVHGEMTTVRNDTLFQINYRKGKEKKSKVLHVF